MAVPALAQSVPASGQIASPHKLPPGEVYVEAVDQKMDGSTYVLHGAAYLETERFILRADDIDYDRAKEFAVARGSVYMKHLEGGEELWAERAEYDVGEDTGKFYKVRGSAPVRIEARPGVLTTSNPFYFEGSWAERLKDRYILYDGFITNCRMPDPLWTFRAPKFDVIPGDRAVARNAVFWMRKVPVFYAPFFIKSLERLPRKSGFLTPNVGNSSRRGKMIGTGYYWAINRSFDASYRTQYFTQRGLAHTVDFRGKPSANSDFDLYLYGVNDRGEKTYAVNDQGEKIDTGERLKQGGLLFSFKGRADLKGGWYARADANYLSSMTFRQAFTETYTEAVSSEVHSLAYLARDWSSYNFDLAFNRIQAFRFRDFKENETVTIQKLPEVSFMSRDRRILKDIPVWVSWESSAGLLRRNQPLFQTRQLMDRMDLYPRVMTAFHWKDINIIPSFAVRETHWGESWGDTPDGKQVLGQNANRFGREFSVAIVPPSFARTYDGPGWLGDKVKHVIEPRVSFLHVSGVDGFDDFIRFDDTELYSNTTEAEISITNRLYAKRGNNVNEVFSWELWQRRYFDPDFGGAVAAGQRNVVLSSLDLTPYAFLDRPRRYSPIVSVLRMNPLGNLGVEWRADYDPALDKKFTNSTIAADARFGLYFVSIGHTMVRTVRLLPDEFNRDTYLAAPANEFRGRFGIGHDNRRGWNAAFDAIYNFRTGQMTIATTQVTYNTDCCGFSLQYRRLGFRNENQFRVAFAVSNIGSFGTLKKQERLF